MKEYIIEVENENEDTLDMITEALNAFNISAYVYGVYSIKEAI